MPTANELYQQARVRGNVSFAAEWGRTQTLLAKMSAGERVSQLGFSSLEPGEFVMAYDAQGQARMRIGHQSDGTVGVVYGNGDPPPVPTAPLVGARQLGVFIGWDGLFAAGYGRPGDFARCDVHMSEEQGFTPDGTTIVGTIPEAGGILVGADSVTHYVKMVAVTHSKTQDGAGYVSSAPTAEAAVLPLPAGQISAGAIGAKQLAVDIALISRLIVGSPNGARLELDGRTGTSPGMRLYDTNGNETMELDATTGDVNIKGTFRTDEAGERITINEFGGNAIAFYPSTGTRRASLYSTSLERNGVIYGGLLMRSPPDAASKSSFIWVTPDGASMYRTTQAANGVSGESTVGGGVYVGDYGANMLKRGADSVDIARVSTDDLGSIMAARGPSTQENYFGVYQGTQGFTGRQAGFSMDWTLGAYRWRFTQSTDQGGNLHPLLYLTNNGGGHCGVHFRPSGIDIYNPAPGGGGPYLNIGVLAVYEYSAEAGKTDVEELPFDPERVVANAPSKMWRYRKDSTRDRRGRKPRRVGPMADDMPDVLQVAMGHNPDGDGTAIGINLNSKVGVLWAATGAQTARLDDLERRLNEMESAR